MEKRIDLTSERLVKAIDSLDEVLEEKILTTIENNDVEAGNIYQLGSIDSLTINSMEVSCRDTVIEFTPTSNFTISFPNNFNVLGGSNNFYVGCKYVICIWYDIISIIEVTL